MGRGRELEGPLFDPFVAGESGSPASMNGEVFKCRWVGGLQVAGVEWFGMVLDFQIIFKYFQMAGKNEMIRDKTETRIAN